MKPARSQKQRLGFERNDQKHIGGKIGVLRHRGASAKILFVL